MTAPFDLRNLLNLPYTELDAVFSNYPANPTSAGPFDFSGFSNQAPNGDFLTSFIRIHFASDLPVARVNQAEAWYMGSLGADYVNKVFVKVSTNFWNMQYYLITFPGLTLNNRLSNQQNVDLNNGNIAKTTIRSVATFQLGTPFQGARHIDRITYEVMWDIATEESALTHL